MHIYFDESGNTGVDLLSREQPLFALASTRLDTDTCNRLIRPLLRQGQREAKYAKLKNSAAGQADLLKFFSSPELHQKNAKFMQADKRYYLITHLVDKLIEPVLHENGIDLYARDAHVRLTNVWYYAGQTIFTDGHWENIVKAFEQALRYTTPESFELLNAALVASSRHVAPGNEDLAAGVLAACGRIEEFLGAYRGGVVFDPAPDLFTAMIHRWMAEHLGKFVITHDKSKPLARNEAFFRALIVDAPTRIIGYGARQVEMPLRVSEFGFGDSAQIPQLQVADLIAGASVDALLAWSGKRPSTAYHEALKKTQLESLFVGGMLPQLTTEVARSPGRGEVSLVDGSAKFLIETGYIS